MAVVKPAASEPPGTASRRLLRWPQASLASYLVALILLASVPMAVLLSMQILRDLNQRTERLAGSLEQLATTLSRSMERELESSLEALELLGETVGEEPPGLVVQRLIQRGAMRPAWDGLFLLDARGHLVGPGDAAATAQLDLPAHDNLVAVSRLIRRTDGSLAVALTTTVSARFRGGTPGAYRLGAWIPASHWQHLLDRSATLQTGFITLFDGTYHVIARTAGLENYVGKTLPPTSVAAMAGRPSGVHRTVMLEGGDVYAAWTLMPISGWGVGVGRPAAPIDREQARQTLLAFGTAGLCLLLGVTLALWVARIVIAPLRALGTAEGLPPDAHLPVQEIARLRDALGCAQARERATRQELQQTADEFQTLFRSSPIGLEMAREAGSTGQRLRNQALQTLWPPDAIVRRRSDDPPMPPPDLPLAQAARTGQPVAPTLLTLEQAGGGSLRFISVQAVPLLGTDGSPRGAMAAVVDVTQQQLIEQQRAEVVEREQAARQVAESASQAKDELLAMLGHELRNPLNAISSAAEVMKLLPAGDPRAEDARAIVERQTRHMARLTDDLLDMARLASGQSRLDRQVLELGSLVRGVVQARRPQGAASGHDLGFEAEQVWVEGDPMRLEQAVNHLISNALKYTPAGGRISTRVRAEQDAALVEVSDTGPGIDPVLLPRVFDVFVQGQRSLDRKGGGLGLGLALVRRVAQLHGGAALADSSAEGSRFTIRLPRSAPPAPAPAVARHHRVRSLLVVEDNPDALSGLCGVLELDGHRIDTAHDGVQGLSSLLSLRPEVALIDIGLPGLSGLDVARQARAAGYAGRMIALSGYGGAADVRDALRAGFDHHLAKPADFDRLRELIEAD